MTTRSKNTQPATADGRFRRTTANLKNLLNRCVQVYLDDGKPDPSGWGWHYLRKVNPKTLVFDNGSPNTAFRVKRDHVKEVKTIGERFLPLSFPHPDAVTPAGRKGI